MHCAGIVYGLYLTLSSWVLFHVATAMTFFTDKCGLADLNTTGGVLRSYCTSVSPCSPQQPPSPITLLAVAHEHCTLHHQLALRFAAAQSIQHHRRRPAQLLHICEALELPAASGPSTCLAVACMRSKSCAHGLLLPS